MAKAASGALINATPEQLAAITSNVQTKTNAQNAEKEGKKQKELELESLDEEETETTESVDTGEDAEEPEETQEAETETEEGDSEETVEDTDSSSKEGKNLVKGADGQFYNLDDKKEKQIYDSQEYIAKLEKQQEELSEKVSQIEAKAEEQVAAAAYDFDWKPEQFENCSEGEAMKDFRSRTRKAEAGESDESVEDVQDDKDLYFHQRTRYFMQKQMDAQISTIKTQSQQSAKSAAIANLRNEHKGFEVYESDVTAYLKKHERRYQDRDLTESLRDIYFIVKGMDDNKKLAVYLKSKKLRPETSKTRKKVPAVARTGADGSAVNSGGGRLSRGTSHENWSKNAAQGIYDKR